jgi:hypothetical protein
LPRREAVDELPDRRGVLPPVEHAGHCVACVVAVDAPSLQGAPVVHQLVSGRASTWQFRETFAAHGARQPCAQTHGVPDSRGMGQQRQPRSLYGVLHVRKCQPVGAAQHAQHGFVVVDDGDPRGFVTTVEPTQEVGAVEPPEFMVGRVPGNITARRGPSSNAATTESRVADALFAVAPSVASSELDADRHALRCSMAFLPDVDNVPIPTTQCSFPASVRASPRRQSFGALPPEYSAVARPTCGRSSGVGTRGGQADLRNGESR